MCLSKEIKFKSCSKILGYAIFCYSVLFLVALFYVTIFKKPDSNNLTLIIIRESAFLFSGLIVFLISRNFYGDRLHLNKPFQAIKYYFYTLLIIILFCCILSIFNIVDLVIFKIEDIYCLVKFIIFCTIPTLFIGIGEEIIFRWFLLNRLTKIVKLNIAIIVGSVIFCLGHNWNIPNMLFTFFGACVFSLIYVYSNSILNSISVHSAWNFGQRFFFEGMSDISYSGQRLIVLKIRDISKYNWFESCFGFLVFLFVLFFIYYLSKYRLEDRFKTNNEATLRKE